jgi:very-short-patch-repair endonuclease
LIQQKDRRKEVYLAAHGWTVLRFRNSKVLTEFDNVTATIMQAVKSLISRPAPATTLPTAS